MRRRLGNVVAHALDRAVLPVIVDAEHAGAAHDADFRHGREFSLDRGDPACAIAFADRMTLRQKAPAKPEILLGENDARSGARRRHRRHQARRARADDENVAMRECFLVFVGIAARRCAPETGGAADRRLVDLLPETRRPHEGLVVEPGREEGRKPAGDRHHVEGERRPAVLARRDEAVEQLDDRRARVRLATGAVAQFDERVGLLRPGSKNAARPVILERAADEADVVGNERRGKRISGKSQIASPVEGER